MTLLIAPLWKALIFSDRNAKAQGVLGDLCPLWQPKVFLLYSIKICKTNLGNYPYLYVDVIILSNAVQYYDNQAQYH